MATEGEPILSHILFWMPAVIYLVLSYASNSFSKGKEDSGKVGLEAVYVNTHNPFARLFYLYGYMEPIKEAALLKRKQKKQAARLKKKTERLQAAKDAEATKAKAEEMRRNLILWGETPE